jgi:subtilase family serine protease
MHAAQYAIDQNLAPVISVSYGSASPHARSDMLGMESWARQANAQGITWVNVSGDSGGADCLSGTSSNNAGLAVDSPANIPEVTGIGGTTFNEGPLNTGTRLTAPTAVPPPYIPEGGTTARPATGPGGGGASTVSANPRQTGWGTGRTAPQRPDRPAASAGRWIHGYPAASLRSMEERRRYARLRGVTALLNHYLVSTGAQNVARVAT